MLPLPQVWSLPKRLQETSFQKKPPFKFTKPKAKTDASKEIKRINSLRLKIQNDPDIPMPEYKTEGSAGMDLASVETGTIPPFTTKRFRTGLKLEIPPGYRGEMHERSSAYTSGMIIRGVIDEDFRGHVEIAAYNGNPFPISVFNDGRPYAQLIIQPYTKVKIEQVTELSHTKRTGGFGSMNLKSITSPAAKLLFNGEIDGRKKKFYLDSGAEGSMFGDEEIGEHHELTELDKPLTFHVANNTEITITHVAKKIKCNIQGYEFEADILIMPNDLDFIFLGHDWLREHNPMIDWRKQQMQITQGDKIYTLRVAEEEQRKLYSIVSAKELTMEKDDTFCLVTRADIDAELEIAPDFYNKDREEINDPDLQALLKKWEHVFRKTLPKEPPTKRNVAHHIALEPGTTPKHTHQYQLSPQHRDAVQEAVQELLEQGHIEPSKSPW